MAAKEGGREEEEKGGGEEGEAEGVGERQRGERGEVAMKEGAIWGERD